jgi:hypothetical protein
MTLGIMTDDTTDDARVAWRTYRGEKDVIIMPARAKPSTIIGRLVERSSVPLARELAAPLETSLSLSLRT